MSSRQIRRGWKTSGRASFPAKTDEGVAAERGMVGEQARVAFGQQRRLRTVGRVCDDARARFAARQQRREDDLALGIAAIADRRERRAACAAPA